MKASSGKKFIPPTYKTNHPLWIYSVNRYSERFCRKRCTGDSFAISEGILSEKWREIAKSERKKNNVLKKGKPTCHRWGCVGQGGDVGVAPWWSHQGGDALPGVHVHVPYDEK